MEKKIINAAVLIIGNEILSGRTEDANLAFLVRTLNEYGVRTAEARVIRDDETEIIKAVNECRAAYDYVFTTGGIGPTHDDITAACVAKALGRGLVQNQDAVKRLEAHYAGGKTKLTEARLRMANTPAGDDVMLIDNPVSGAPGFACENVYVLPGVPRIMQAMITLLAPKLEGGTRVQTATVAAYIPEGDLADPLAEVQGRFADVEIGSYPYFRAGKFGAALVMRADDEARLAECADALRAMVRTFGVEPVEEEL
ncbi:MAG: competence/damage-inducible protein A [Rhodospirillales bacterium]